MTNDPARIPLAVLDARRPTRRNGGVTWTRHANLLPIEDVTRLRGCLNDLINTMALPALWTSGEPPQDVGAMLHALPGMLEGVAQRTSALAAANQELMNDVAERERAEDALRERASRVALDR